MLIHYIMFPVTFYEIHVTIYIKYGENAHHMGVGRFCWMILVFLYGNEYRRSKTTITKTCKTAKHLPGFADRQLSPVVLASGKRSSKSKRTKEIINLKSILHIFRHLLRKQNEYRKN